MNYNFRNKNKTKIIYITKTKKKRKRNRNILNRIPNQYSQRVQTFGIGRKVLQVNRDVVFSTTLTNNICHFVEIKTALVNSNEFLLSTLAFQFFKIKCIKLIIPPTNNISIGYINVAWNNEDKTLTQIVESDSSKRVFYYGVRFKIFKFRPIDTTFSLNNYTYNLREWVATNQYQDLPGRIYLYGEQTTVTQLVLEVEFRGNSDRVNSTPIIPTLVKEVMNKNANLVGDVQEFEGEEEINENKENDNNENKNKNEVINELINKIKEL